MRYLYFQRWLLLGLFSLMIGGNILAQCEVEGIVMDGTPFGNCQKVIVDLNNYTVYEPTSNIPYEFGTLLLFGFDAADITASCGEGVPVNITCIEESTSTNSLDCGFLIDFQNPYGTTFFASIYNSTDFGPYQPQEVEWSFQPTGTILGNEANLEFNSSGLAGTELLCVTYTVTYSDGSTCSDEICQPFDPSIECVDEEQIDISLDCPGFSDPVCGCDGVEYLNACVAQFHYGVTDWTLGPCANDPSDCEAFFYYEKIGEEFLFFNQSFGIYNTAIWDMGDGQSITTSEFELNYLYEEDGFYTVCLTVSNDQGCSSTYCNEIYQGQPEDICLFSDCVYPGDSDGDGLANIYDVLNIGVGFGMVGPPREDADLDWNAQYSPNWDNSTINGINYKHLDCNGDGTINKNDLSAIEFNYEAPQNVIGVTEPGAAKIWLEFEEDSIVIDDNSPEFIEVTAHIRVGTEENPIEDLQGFAMTLDYPEEFIVEASALVDYNDNSFFGFSNDIFWMRKDRVDVGELDLAFSQKEESKNGSGIIGDVTFIIIVDIIGGRTEEAVPLTIPIKGTVAVNDDGAIKALGEITEDAQLTFILDNNITSSTEAFISNKIHVYPNPAKDQLSIHSGDLTTESIEIFDAVGQQVLNFGGFGNLQSLAPQTTLDVSNLNPGVYLMKIFTKEGIGTKRVVIQR